MHTICQRTRTLLNYNYVHNLHLINLLINVWYIHVQTIDNTLPSSRVVFLIQCLGDCATPLFHRYLPEISSVQYLYNNYYT